MLLPSVIVICILVLIFKEPSATSTIVTTKAIIGIIYNRA